MNKDNFVEAVNTSGLSDQAKFRLNEINEIKDYFNSEIRERKAMSKKLSKYIADFDYIFKSLIFCNRWRSVYYFFYKRYWSFCRNRKCTFYSCIFLDNRNNKKAFKHNKK